MSDLLVLVVLGWVVLGWSVWSLSVLAVQGAHLRAVRRALDRAWDADPVVAEAEIVEADRLLDEVKRLDRWHVWPLRLTGGLR